MIPISDRLPISEVRACRCCGSASLAEILHHDRVPLAGVYLEATQLGSEPLLPLTVLVCQSCSLVQLREVVAPAMYAGYLFAGSTSASYRSHLDGLAQHLINTKSAVGQRVMEIGSSDGFLLERLRDWGRNDVFGYEPSVGLREASDVRHVPTTAAFFSMASISECPLRPVDLVIARHVLEHVGDVRDVLAAVCAVLRPGGLLVVEVPDADAILSERLYAHFYHAHLSYFSSDSLVPLLAEYGFFVSEERSVPVHGGSLLLTCEYRGGNAARRASWTSNETALDRWRSFARNARRYFNDLHDFITRAHATDRVVVGYGAAERTVTMLGLAHIGAPEIRLLVDRNTLLHGLYTPGSHLEIRPVEELLRLSVDDLVVFASSFEAEIVGEQRGRLPPTVRFVSVAPAVRYLDGSGRCA